MCPSYFLISLSIKRHHYSSSHSNWKLESVSNLFLSQLFSIDKSYLSCRGNHHFPESPLAPPSHLSLILSQSEMIILKCKTSCAMCSVVHNAHIKTVKFLNMVFHHLLLDQFSRFSAMSWSQLITSNFA